MILVDASVWIDHLRTSEKRLLHLLNDGSVLTHPLVIEELACGYLRDRSTIIENLQALPSAPVATHTEIVGLISKETLYGVGLGAVDVHLIASAMLSSASLWSKDKVLSREARRLSIEA